VQEYCATRQHLGPIIYYLKLVEVWRIELQSSTCKADIIPLYYTPIFYYFKTGQRAGSWNPNCTFQKYRIAFILLPDCITLWWSTRDLNPLHRPLGNLCSCLRTSLYGQRGELRYPNNSFQNYYVSFTLHTDNLNMVEIWRIELQFSLSQSGIIPLYYIPIFYFINVHSQR
jgi:hypothetical protein